MTDEEIVFIRNEMSHTSALVLDGEYHLDEVQHYAAILAEFAKTVLSSLNDSEFRKAVSGTKPDDMKAAKARASFAAACVFSAAKQPIASPSFAYGAPRFLNAMMQSVEAVHTENGTKILKKPISRRDALELAYWAYYEEAERKLDNTNGKKGKKSEFVTADSGPTRAAIEETIRAWASGDPVPLPQVVAGVGSEIDPDKLRRTVIPALKASGFLISPDEISQFK